MNNVLRKEINGTWTEFRFPEKSRFFLVKNLSDDDCLVAFDSNTDEDKCFLISAGIGEEVSKSFRKVECQDFYTDKIYVKGSGAIEVQALDI